MSQKIEHTGIITRIDNNNVQVQIIQVSACSTCHAKSACTASDMDELQAVLKDEAKLKKLYGQMESPELDDMIQQGIYLSHLVGRSMD